MQININSTDISIDAQLKKRLTQQFQFLCSKHDDSISRISLTLSDVNGPKGGNDKQCKVVVFLIGREEVVITERQSTLQRAIDRALQRTGFNLQQRLKRRHRLKHRGTPKRRYA